MRSAPRFFTSARVWAWATNARHSSAATAAIDLFKSFSLETMTSDREQVLDGPRRRMIVVGIVHVYATKVPDRALLRLDVRFLEESRVTRELLARGLPQLLGRTAARREALVLQLRLQDRKSTRLNSSH